MIDVIGEHDGLDELDELAGLLEELDELDGLDGHEELEELVDLLPNEKCVMNSIKPEKTLISLSLGDEAVEYLDENPTR